MTGHQPAEAGPRSRRWGAAAAALALAVTVSGVAAIGLGQRAADPSRESRTEPHVLDGAPAGTVPSVFAHSRESATDLLETVGLRVRSRNAISCDPAGRPIGTDPPTGAEVEPGDAVTLLVAHQTATTDCSADLSEPWRFLDFATGLGPAPRFADEVTLFVDRRPAVALAGLEARRGAWGEPSALTELGGAARQVVDLGDELLAPTLEVQQGTPPDAVCGVRRPAALGDREALTLTIDVGSGVPFRCPARVSVYRTDGDIDAVMTWTERPLAAPADRSPVPDVTGMTLAEARDAVTAAGLTARVEELEACDPRRGVVEQAPTQQSLDEDMEDDPSWSGVVTLVVEVPHTTRECAALASAAAGFVRFARGGPPPPWSPQVQQLFGYALREVVTAARADDPAAWSWCSGASATDCELSALAVAGSGQVRTGEWREHPECELMDEGGLPPGLDPEDHIVLFPADPPHCDADWAVELWIDDSGRTTAVNLLVAEAASPSG